MSNDRERMVQMLARQVLSMREPDGSTPRATPGIERAGGATVEIDIRGMVHNIRRQIWIDSAQLNAWVTEEIERQAGAIDLRAEVAKVVKAEISQAISGLAVRAREVVGGIVRDEIHRRIGELPARIARKLTTKLWDEAFKDGES